MPLQGWSLDSDRALRPAAVFLAAFTLLIGTQATVLGATASYVPALDVNSMLSTTSYMGADAWWQAGYTGAGVDVALIDTGVSPVEGLATPGKVIYGPDLSFESQFSNLTNLDTNGHGTFMAGLIAGRDMALTAPYATAPATAYRGVAPDARIISLKVAVADGAVDVSQVIAAIDWVVQHRNDNGMRIRVLNLSFGTDSTQPTAVDPLAFAVEQAWKAGIVVVTPTGNDGFVRHTGTISNPARDPMILAIGATDSMGTPLIADDSSASFSASGSPSRLPDLAAPGVHIQGLRVPGSYVDLMYPEGRIDDRYMRGSGTSESAAITSGAVALILQRYPDLTPDAVKALLRNTAQPLAAGSKFVTGAGELNMAVALAAALPTKLQRVTPATGGGSLEQARGTVHVSMDGVALIGERDIFGHAFDSVAMADLETTGSAWTGGVWNGSTWTGSSWSGSSWSGSSWSGSSWSGSSWSGSSWSGSSWSGNSWSGSSWSGSSWSGSSWSGSSWSGSSWSGSSWSTGSWS